MRTAERVALTPVAILAALAGGLLRARPAWAQCAMCGAAAASGKVGVGIAYSIFFLLGTLFLVVLWFVLLVWRRERSAAADGRRESPRSRLAATSHPTGGGPAVAPALAAGGAPVEK